MIDIAIKLLWVFVGAMVVGGVIYFLLKGLRTFMPNVIDDKIEKGLWLVYAALVLIYLLLAFTGHAPLAISG